MDTDSVTRARFAASDVTSEETTVNYPLLTNYIGGIRIGLDRAGWEAICAAVFEDGARKAYQKRFPGDETCDVAGLDIARTASVDAIVVRAETFADARTGKLFVGAPRNMKKTLSLSDVLNQAEPRLFVVETSEGSRRGQACFSFAALLNEQTRRGFRVRWTTLNACDHKSMQERRRLVVVACRGIETQSVAQVRAFWESLSQLDGTASTARACSYHWDVIRWGHIQDVFEQTRPRVGARRPNDRFFQSFGVAEVEGFGTSGFSIIRDGYRRGTLEQALGVGQTGGDDLASVRFQSRNGVKALGFKPNGFAHSVGPWISGWPLVAAPKAGITSELFGGGIGDFFNWIQERDGHFVGRITPERAVRLFGPDRDRIENAIANDNGALSWRYGLVSRLAVPTMIKRVASRSAQLICSATET